jgi:hypothetical protein
MDKLKTFLFPITKEVFIKIMEAIQAQDKHDRACAKAFKVILPNDFTTRYDNDRMIEMLIEILKEAMADTWEYSFIDYFIYELDFGRKYKDGCIVSETKENINLSSIEKLWDFLANNNQTNK